MVVDVVIPLSTGSHWQDNEIKFALRSLEKYVKGVRDVYIIGKKPLSVTNTAFYNFPDQYKYPARNIYAKIMKACKIKEISDPFLFMNDDHFFLREMHAPSFPYFYCGLLREALYNKTNHRYTVENTIKVLMATHPLKNFDTHTPILYHKKQFIETMDMFDWTTPHAFAIKSLYCNMQRIEGVYEPDGKMRRGKIIKIEQASLVYNFLKDKHVFSVDDSALTNAMKQYFLTLYPLKSKYEL